MCLYSTTLSFVGELYEISYNDDDDDDEQAVWNRHQYDDYITRIQRIQISVNARD